MCGEGWLVKKTSRPVETFRKDYRPPDFRIRHVDLRISLGFSRAVVEAELYASREAGRTDCDLKLNGENFCVKSIAVGDKRLEDVKTTEEGLLVVPSELLPNTGEFVIKSNVEFDPSSNLTMDGLYKSGSILCTQCEAEGFRKITPFIDRPDVMSTYKVRLEADAKEFPVLLSNGNLIEEGREGERHFAVYEDPFPKPCYLFAVVAGDLKCLKDTHIRPPKVGEKEGRPVSLSIWAEPRDLGKLDWAMKCLKMAMKWDEDKFGLVYDLDVFNIVSASHFNMGAMENKSLNIFNNSLLLTSVATSTDGDFANVLRVIGHEYFHNWTGNRVTCRDWFQLTLKEGLTNFRDQEFSRDMTSPGIVRIEDVACLRARQFAEDAGPLAHPIRPESYIAMDNFYTMTVYEKGSEVIRMYKTLLGTEGFRRGMDLYFKRHDGTGVTCDDFRAAMADANEYDLTQFERWYSQAGTPEVKVVETGRGTFQLSQSTPTHPDNKNYVIPVGVAYIGKESKTIIPGTEEVRVLTTKTADWSFADQLADVKEDVVLSVFRDFSAPVNINFPRTSEDLIFLFANERDAYSRWEAGQKLYRQLLLANAEAIRNGEPTTNLDPALLDAFRTTLTTKTDDPGFQAYLLILPTVDDLMQGLTNCDPTAFHRARKDLKRQISAALRAEFRAIYDRLSSLEGPYGFESIDIGNRRLRNVCLGYLCDVPVDQRAEAAQLAANHFETAASGHDKIAGLSVLSSIPSKEREQCLQKFYDSAKDDPIQLDKWFAIQSSADLPDEIHDNVAALQRHVDFDPKNPNRLRSVVSAFVNNRPHFHSADGRGYKILADCVAHIDSFNPQIAARMATQLTGMNRLDAKRQEMMREHLKAIKERPGCSRETYEICHKALGDTN